MASRAPASRCRRFRRRLAAAAICIGAAAVSVQSPAGASEARVPGTTTWLLSYDRGDRFCLAHAFFPRSGIGLGFVSDGEALGVGLVNQSWTLREWGDYDLDFRFDDTTGITARFVATHATAMAAELDSTAEDDFRSAKSVEVIAAGGRSLGHLSLKGSARAIDYVRTCGQIAGGRAGDSGAIMGDATGGSR